MDRIFKGRPETRIENPDYLDGLTDTLEALTDEELAWVSDPREGVHTVCKFLPTPADVFDLIRKRREAADKFKAFGKPKNLLQPDHDPVLSKDEIGRRKRIVMNTLGYNPAAPAVQEKRKLVPPTIDDLASMSIKTPAGPISPQLIALLVAQGVDCPATRRHKAERSAEAA